jgi:hypothetical protein
VNVISIAGAQWCSQNMQPEYWIAYWGNLTTAIEPVSDLIMGNRECWSLMKELSKNRKIPMLCEFET